jgi:chromosome segregation ATPase
VHEEVRILAAQLSETDLADVQGRATYWSTRVAVVERALGDASARKDERRKDTERFDTRRFELTTRLSEAETSLSSLDADKASMREREGVLHTQIEELNVFIEPAEKDLETAEQEEARLQETEAHAQRALATAERLFGQVQLEQLRKQEGLDNLRQRIMDDFGLVMFDYAADVSGPVPLPLEGMVEELPVVTEVSPELESQLAQSRTHVRRMGPINPKQNWNSTKSRIDIHSCARRLMICAKPKRT